MFSTSINYYYDDNKQASNNIIKAMIRIDKGHTYIIRIEVVQSQTKNMTIWSNKCYDRKQFVAGAFSSKGILLEETGEIIR